MEDDPYKPSDSSTELLEEGERVQRSTFFSGWSYGVLVIPLLGAYPCFFLIGGLKGLLIWLALLVLAQFLNLFFDLFFWRKENPGD